MSDVPAVAKKIQIEEIDFRSPASESMLQKIAGSINYLLDSIDAAAPGDIIGAPIAEGTFIAANPTWVLCKGQSVNGTDLADIKDPGPSMYTLPDLRGKPPRMKSYGQLDPEGLPSNPDGDLALGTLQLSEQPSHNHDMVFTNPFPVCTTNSAGTIPILNPTGADRFRITGLLTYSFDIQDTSLGTFGNHPEAKVTNWFIKVNY